MAVDMKVVMGSPGTRSGLLLRIGQCLFAGASIAVMVTALGFSNYTAFWYGSSFRFPFRSVFLLAILNSVFVALCTMLTIDLVLVQILEKFSIKQLHCLLFMSLVEISSPRVYCYTL